MADETGKTPKKLDADDIITKRSVGRRAVLGIMAAGTVGAVMAPGQAAAADSDNGTWTDSGACPRGHGTGVTDRDSGNTADPGGWGYTGITDQDNGNITDHGGHGRGRPYRC